MPDTRSPADPHPERLLQAHPATRTEVVRLVAQVQDPAVAEDIPEAAEDTGVSEDTEAAEDTEEDNQDIGAACHNNSVELSLP